MKKLFPLFVFLISLQLFSQEDAWVYLKDKPNSATFLAAPLTMLSQRSLDRRTRQNIALDIKDVPVETSFYNQIKNTSGITVLAKSKWLNAIHVQGTQARIISLKNTFTFIQSIEFADNFLNASGKRLPKSNTITKRNKFTESTTDFNYGNTQNQTEMLKADFLHKQNFTGSGMHIAVIDAGFPNVNTLSAFARIRENNQILGGYDFVDRSTSFYGGHHHGTNVLSTIAGYIDGQFVGSAPDASFYLFRTEDSANEVPLEESLWVEAAERADSLGVDVINTSLGYSTFDESRYNYSYADLNGNTTFITRGAEIGVSRGMIVVNSAGNEGNDAWNYISAPADANSVFTVGAVNATKVIAGFSSFGPTSDNRIKPDVLAQGQNVFVLDQNIGAPRTSNGTSFSSPIMAGVVACFWQAFPNLTNTQIMQRIRETGDKFNNPHEQYGYGIPNFETAYGNVLNVTEQDFIKSISVYPNPISSTFTLKTSSNDLSGLSIQIFNVIGKKVYEEKGLKSNTINVSELNTGIYILKIMSETQQKTIKLIKK
ncbi:MAG: S8 family serine peptidase [Polaribacter sp.]|nr:S8 family serine peptidase [Polaribacter sp.]MDG1812233.1 S8 family serine peptidase [Polaribacter sp.]MDG1993779.1 S8 family serine peptidase [Polaribacter sp.]